MTVAIVTDSTCDIPPALAQKRSIHIVPNLVVIDGQSYEDGAQFSREDFYRNLPLMKTPPTTAAQAWGVYAELYRELLAKGHEAVFSVHASRNLTAIYNVAVAGAQEFGERVRVVDGETLSLGLGFQALAAAEQAAGGAGLDALDALAADVRRRQRVFAMLDTLEYVRRSGRVSWARARLGNLLQVKPFVQVVDNGTVHNMGESRTRKKGILHLFELLERLGPLERLAILHTNAEADARHFLSELASPPPDTLIVNVTTVIGAHVGPNGLGFAAVVK
jgi:DegV family protein with EDD domain